MHCLVIEDGMTSLNFQTAVQKNEARLFSDHLQLVQSEITDTMF